MKKILKKFIAMSLALLMVLCMIPTTVQAENEDEYTSEIVEDPGTIDTPQLVDPSESSLTFDENYSGAVGEQVAISATFVCFEEPDSFEWDCNVENGVTFSQTSVMGPVETGEANTYWISTMVTGVKEGNYTISLTVSGAFAATATATTNYTVTEAVSSRYTVLVLDGSSSMSGTPADEQKEAASNFCSSVLSAAGNNYIAIVRLASSSSVGCEFTNDLDTLNNYISSFRANSGTNTNQALEIAGDLLDNVSDEGKGVTKNIFICSDGLPQSGSRTSDGPYTNSDSSSYQYANTCYNTATSLKDKGYAIYALGFFHKLSGSQLAFGQRFMSDLASESCYYEVIDAADLDFTFGEVAEDITVEPVSIDVSNVELISETDDASTYRITANITNNSKTTTLTNVFANIDEGENATLTEGDWKQSLDSLGANESTTFSWTISIDRKNHYNDGGVHYFIVYSGSDQTVTISVQGSIALDSQNHRSNELDFSTEVWNFGNFSEEVKSVVQNPDGTTTKYYYPHPINEDDENALLAGLSASLRAEFEDDVESGAGGHCFGMAISTILSKMNIFDVSEYSDADNLRDCEKTDRITSLLCYYQMVQSFPSFVYDSQNFIFKGYNVSADRKSYVRKPEEEYTQGVIDQLNTIADKADQVKSGGSPVLLSFYCEGLGGHAVVAYATETGSWKYSGKTYNKRVLIYDSNTANGFWKIFNNIWDEDYCLYFNDGTAEWTIPAYSNVNSDNPGAYLKRACNDLEILNTHNYKDGLYNYIAELRCQNETALRMESSGKQHVIMGTTGEVTGDDTLVVYGDDNILTDENNTGTLHVVLPNEDADYNLSTLSGEEETLDYYISDDDLYMSVEADAAMGTWFNCDSKISLKGNTGEFEITIADDTIPSGDFNTYTITGENEGDITVEITEDGAVISGDNLNGASIEASDGNTTSTTEITEDISKVELSREGDSLVVKNEPGDKDQEETPGTPSTPDDTDDGNNGSGQENTNNTENQTVNTVSNKTDSGNNKTNEQNASNVRTGDTQNITIWVVTLSLALIVIISISVKLYNRRKK